MALPPKDYVTEGSPIKIEGQIQQLAMDMEAELDRFIAETYTGYGAVGWYQFNPAIAKRFFSLPFHESSAIQEMIRHRYRLAGWGEMLFQNHLPYSLSIALQAPLARQHPSQHTSPATINGFLETINQN